MTRPIVYGLAANVCYTSGSIVEMLVERWLKRRGYLNAVPLAPASPPASATTGVAYLFAKADVNNAVLESLRPGGKAPKVIEVRGLRRA